MMNKFGSKVSFGKYSLSSLGSNLLNFYNFKFSEALTFGIGEGFYFALKQNEDGWKVESHNTNLVDDLCSNLTFFTNHFVAYSANELLEQIKENLYVKRYPFIISFNVLKPMLNLLFDSDHIETNEIFQKVLVYCYDPADDSVVINDGIKHFGKISSHNFLKLFSFGKFNLDKIEWKIYIPPRRIMRASYIVRHILNRIYLQMMNMPNDGNNYYGIHGIEKLFDIIKNGELECDIGGKLLKDILLHENSNGFYRDIFAEFLIEVNTKYKNSGLIPLAKSYKHLGFMWKDLLLNIRNNRSEKLKSADKILMDQILELEKTNLKRLKEIV